MAESQRPNGDRNDGLVNVRCPYCGQLWYRIQPSGVGPTHEIKCPSGRCKRIVLYRVDRGRVEDLTATTL